MGKIAVYIITSGLHDEQSVQLRSARFLEEIMPDGGYDYKGEDYSEFGTADLNIIYIRTGGAEGIFLKLFPSLLETGVTRFTLLASGESNSLAASLEILSWLKQHNFSGEVLHGSAAYIRSRIEILSKVASARSTLCDMSVGIIGKPSDWLIASECNPEAVLQKLGIDLIDIPMDVLLDVFENERSAMVQEQAAGAPPQVRASFPDAVRIYRALKVIAEEYRLDALTVRCFDLLGTVHNTGCYALARLNSEGIPSGCEGDVPALLTMLVAHALTGFTGFQANPARIDVETGEMLFAHCTIPFCMVDGFSYDTHFESGIGVGIHGHFPEGPVTVFKLSGDLESSFIAEGELLRNQYEANLCRTQVWVKLSPDDARYFLTDPIGNHHIIIPGHHGDLLREFSRVAILKTTL